MLEIMTLESLSKIDNGRLAVAIDQELIEINRDLANRPFDDSARTLILKIKIKPAAYDDKNRKLEQVNVDFELKKTLPSRTTSPTVMAVNDENQFLFNDLSPDEPKQHTIDEAIDDDEDSEPGTLKIGSAASL